MPCNKCHSLIKWPNQYLSRKLVLWFWFVGWFFFPELWTRLFNTNTDCSGGWAKHKVVLKIHIVFLPLSPHSFIRSARVGKCFLIIPILSAPQNHCSICHKETKKWVGRSCQIKKILKTVNHHSMKYMVRVIIKNTSISGSSFVKRRQNHQKKTKIDYVEGLEHYTDKYS